MSIERYVMRPVARDAVEFDGTYESALEIALWLVEGEDESSYSLTTINEKATILTPAVQSIMLTRNITGMFGAPQTVPVLMWGFTNTGAKPLTIHTEGGGTSANPGYFVVKNPDNSFVAIPPEKFNELYRKQN